MLTDTDRDQIRKLTRKVLSIALYLCFFQLIITLLEAFQPFFFGLNLFSFLDLVMYCYIYHLITQTLLNWKAKRVWWCCGLSPMGIYLDYILVSGILLVIQLCYQINNVVKGQYVISGISIFFIIIMLYLSGKLYLYTLSLFGLLKELDQPSYYDMEQQILMYEQLQREHQRYLQLQLTTETDRDEPVT